MTLAATTSAGVDPWQRFGWLTWAPWMGFLAFPLLAAVAEPRPLDRVVGVVVTALFAAVYAAGCHRLGSTRSATHRATAPSLVLLVLVLLAAVGFAVIGLDTLGYLPFLQSFVVFGLRRPWNWVAASAVAAAALLLPLALGQLGEWWFLLVIIVGVSSGSAAGRLLSDYGEERSRIQDDLTVTAERERVARDVHDVLGHSLTVVSLKAELAQRLLEADPARARAELAEVQDLVREALTEVRATVGGLRSARLEREIPAAASALAAAGITADLPDDVAVVEPEHRAVVAWFLREAVTNVVRHSAAQRCAVRLSARGAEVVDDGRGAADASGNGLRGLRERVEAARGRLVVEPGCGGRGTRVAVRW